MSEAPPRGGDLASDDTSLQVDQCRGRDRLGQLLRLIGDGITDDSI
jgi:hypothetical protein